MQKIVFNTDAFAQRERFAAYREQLAKWSCGLELSTPDPFDFHANLELRRVGSLEIMINTLSAIELARTPPLVQDGDDALLLMLLLDGQARQSQLGDQRLIHAGQAVIFGWNAILYLGASMLFSVGLHPLGSRWIQEHFTLDPEQETASYYGSLNRLALNVGYHNEHHDFPAVPWNRLPRVRDLAPEFYSELKSPRSWTMLWLAFLFDPRYSLYSRVLRPAHGK